MAEPDLRPAPSYSIVVPTIGRRCLGDLLESLAHAEGPAPAEIVLVDDRPGDRAAPLDALVPGGLPAPLRVVATNGGQGPAAARNRGWRSTRGCWVAFLDDDVVVGRRWYADLVADLAGLPFEVAASQGRIQVPLPLGRAPTDWERNVAGLERACWATADMAYRRRALEELEGFDERFRRAFREDSDLALRAAQAGWSLVRGERSVDHPVRPAGRGVSVRLQAGNRDDVTMRVLHGPRWRSLVAAGDGRTGTHLATATALATAAVAGASSRRAVAAAAATAWAALTAAFAWSRIGPGPRTADEVLTMAATSVLIPPSAVGHCVAGWLAAPSTARRRRAPGGAGPLGSTPADRARFGPVPRPLPADPRWCPKAVLFDRDGTLIVDRHYLGDPDGVTPMPGASLALHRLRRAGLRTGVVTNQSGVARGLLTATEMAAVNERVDSVLGPFDHWAVCPHGPDDGCGCRKPAPGLVREAAGQLGVAPWECAVIGDIAADVEAAEAAGARGVLVPTPRTRPAEIRRARQVAPDLVTAADLVLGGRC